MRIYKVAEDEKCGGCNWGVRNLYLVGNSQEDAEARYHENDRGLCADCLVETLQEVDCEIKTDKKL